VKVKYAKSTGKMASTRISVTGASQNLLKSSALACPEIRVIVEVMLIF